MSLFIQSLTSKSPEWSYEKEWRIIRDEAACGSRWDDENKGALLDAISPSAIFLGCCASDELTSTLNVANFMHIVGGACGTAFGFAVAKPRR